MRLKVNFGEPEMQPVEVRQGYRVQVKDQTSGKWLPLQFEEPIQTEETAKKLARVFQRHDGNDCRVQVKTVRGWRVLLLLALVCSALGQTNYITAGPEWQSLAWVPVTVTQGTNSFNTILITNLTRYRQVLHVHDSGTNVCSEVLSNVVISKWESNIVWGTEQEASR